MAIRQRPSVGSTNMNIRLGVGNSRDGSTRVGAPDLMLELIEIKDGYPVHYVDGKRKPGKLHGGKNVSSETKTNEPDSSLTSRLPADEIQPQSDRETVFREVQEKVAKLKQVPNLLMRLGSKLEPDSDNVFAHANTASRKRSDALPEVVSPNIDPLENLSDLDAVSKLFSAQDPNEAAEFVRHLRERSRAFSNALTPWRERERERIWVGH